MVDKICTILTNRIRKSMPEIDDERAEVIHYGLEHMVGEIPKTFIMLAVAYLLGILELAFITFISIVIYKGASGGIHLKTHLGCMLFTIGFYCIIPFVSQFFELSFIIKSIVIGVSWIFGMIMIKKYAPADTEDIPILDKKVRKKRRILAFVSYTIGLLIALVLKDSTISNIIILASVIQTLTITKLAYRLANNKYGYEVYGDTSTQNV